MTGHLSSVFRRSMIVAVLFCAAAASGGEIDLLVGDRASNSILRFDAESGDPLGTFAAMPGRFRPNGIRSGPQGDLYVSAASRFDTDVILRYDGQSGALLGKFAAGSGIDSPMDLLFGPDGNSLSKPAFLGALLRDRGQHPDSAPGPKCRSFSHQSVRAGLDSRSIAASRSLLLHLPGPGLPD